MEQKHLTTEEIEYFIREIKAPSVDAENANQHLMICSDCRTAFQRALNPLALNFLNGLTEDELEEPECMHPELIARYVHGVTDGYETSLVEMHRGYCLPCNLAINELQEYHEQSLAERHQKEQAGATAVIAPALVLTTEASPASGMQDDAQNRPAISFKDRLLSVFVLPQLAWSAAAVLLLSLLGLWNSHSMLQKQEFQAKARAKQAEAVQQTIHQAYQLAKKENRQITQELTQAKNAQKKYLQLRQNAARQDSRNAQLSKRPSQEKQIAAAEYIKHQVEPKFRALQELVFQQALITAAETGGNSSVALLGVQDHVLIPIKPSKTVVDQNDGTFSFSIEPDNDERGLWKQALQSGTTIVFAIYYSKSGQDEALDKTLVVKQSFSAIQLPKQVSISWTRASKLKPGVYRWYVVAYQNSIDDAHIIKRSLSLVFTIQNADGLKALKQMERNFENFPLLRAAMYINSGEMKKATALLTKIVNDAKTSQNDRFKAKSLLDKLHSS